MSKFIIQDSTGMYFVVEGIWSFVAADAYQFSDRALALQIACLYIGAKVLTVSDAGKVLYVHEALCAGRDFISHIASDPLVILIVLAFVLFAAIGFGPEPAPAASQSLTSASSGVVRHQQAGFDASWLKSASGEAR